MATAKNFTVTLLLPGLYGFTPQQWQEFIPHAPMLPGLSALLNRSRRTIKNPSSFESLLGTKFTLKGQTPLPVAALTYLHDKNQPPQHHVLRADPVCLKADRDCLYFLGYGGLQVASEEAQKLAEEINQIYVNDGWSLQIGAADRWYVCAEKKPLIETFPLTEVFGKNIAGYLPRGAEEKKWRIVLTELQMLLHSSEVNTQRTMSQRLPINSVWLWGEGELPEHAAGHTYSFDCVWSNDALCLGLAQWAQCKNEKLPHVANEYFKQNNSGRHLIVFDDMRILAKENFQSWIAKLEDFDEKWFTPLLEAFDKRCLSNINIEIENGMVFEFAKQTIWNKWRHQNRLWYEWFN